MIAAERVRAKLTLLERYRRRLERLAALPPEEYLTEHDLEGRYAVQVAAQICIDVANHVIASEGWEPATDFRESFTRLEENEVVSSQLAERLRALAGLRNLLVHLYGDVDDALIHGYLPEAVDDLSRFARLIAERAGDVGGA